jgi:hypothetical protein
MDTLGAGDVGYSQKPLYVLPRGQQHIAADLCGQLLHTQQGTQCPAVAKFQGGHIDDQPLPSRQGTRDRSHGTGGLHGVQLSTRCHDKVTAADAAADLDAHHRAAFPPEQSGGDWTQRLFVRPASNTTPERQPAPASGKSPA